MMRAITNGNGIEVFGTPAEMADFVKDIGHPQTRLMLTPALVEGVKCDKCGKVLKNEIGLRVHANKMHS